MGITTKNIKELLGMMDSEHLQLPEIQREFVWKHKNIKMLFDSLYRELPIGQMLVWKPTGEVHAKAFHKKKQKHSAGQIDSFYGYLLDGQQRLTAISRVRDGDEEYPLMYYLWPDENQGFYWDRTMDDSSPWCILVADILNQDFSVSNHLKRLQQDPDFKEKHADIVLESLGRLQGILQYPISVIEFESKDYKLATELFIRFNSTGKKLNANDLALADLATRVPGLTSTDMGKVLDRWKPHFQFTRPFLIQCLAAVHNGRMDLKSPDRVWTDSTPSQIRESWKKTAKALNQVIELMTGTVRWDSGTWVPSFNALIPLVYILAHGKPFSLSELEQARTWLLMTGARSYFSGAAYTEIDQLLRKLRHDRTMKQLWNVTRRRLAKIRADDFETTRRSGPTMSLYISMLRSQDAHDWKYKTSLDGTVIGHNAKLHVHHFFPRALLSKHGYSAVETNTFANFTILSAKTNFDIGMEEPATYVPRLGIKKQDLVDQCIPQNPKLWHVSKYSEFIQERQRLLAERSNHFLGL